MSTKIKGAEYPLSKIFSSDFDYEIPSFQRPYAWTEEETGDLFDDLYDFYISEADDEQYFLGSIVLVKEDDKPYSEVIDGQQRLTTLTILLAAITSKLSGEDRDDFKTYIIEPGRASQGLASKPRVHIRKRDNDFFQKYIQGMDFEHLFTLDADAQDTEAKTNIVKNARLLMGRIEDNLASVDEIIRFGAYLVQRCFLVAVSTPTRQAAFRIFSVMNSRGMSLLATDIIKADIIGAIRESWHDEYNNKWEEMEVEVGRNGFNDLFGHIRMIIAKVKAKKALQDEFYSVVFPDTNGKDITEKDAINFIENILSPFSEAYRVVKNSEFASTTGADNVNDILRWLNRIDNSDWIPVAMQFYVKHKDNAALMNRFLRRLERLAAYMRATSWDVTHRIERYAKVLAEIESIEPEDFGVSIELTPEEVKEFLNRLNSDMYKMVSNKRNYLILRLDSFVADGAASYDSKILTIEHVLPQTVNDESQWAEWWPDTDERELWVHKIGNLLPLAKRKNSQAQNYDFDMKKDKYFRGKTGVASYALTTQVLMYSQWTPKTVKERQEELINIYRKNWDLFVPESSTNN